MGAGGNCIRYKKLLLYGTAGAFALVILCRGFNHAVLNIYKTAFNSAWVAGDLKYLKLSLIDRRDGEFLHYKSKILL
jgi:hypothetical protein